MSIDTDSKQSGSSQLLALLSNTLGGLSFWAGIKTIYAVCAKKAQTTFLGSEIKVPTGVMFTLVGGSLALIFGKLSKSLDKDSSSSYGVPSASGMTIAPITLTNTTEANELPKNVHADKFTPVTSSHADQIAATKSDLEISR